MISIPRWLLTFSVTPGLQIQDLCTLVGHVTFDLCPAQNAALLQSETYADGDDEKMMIKSHKKFKEQRRSNGKIKHWEMNVAENH